MTRADYQLISESLRVAIDNASVSRYVISQETGIDQSVLSKFLKGNVRLSQTTIDTLAEYLGLTLR